MEKEVGIEEEEAGLEEEDEKEEEEEDEKKDAEADEAEESGIEKDVEDWVKRDLVSAAVWLLDERRRRLFKGSGGAGFCCGPCAKRFGSAKRACILLARRRVADDNCGPPWELAWDCFRRRRLAWCSWCLVCCGECKWCERTGEDEIGEEARSPEYEREWEGERGAEMESERLERVKAEGEEGYVSGAEAEAELDLDADSAEPHTKLFADFCRLHFMLKL